MPKLLPALAAGTVALSIALAPTLTASAAPAQVAHPAKVSKNYTLSVTGNGKTAEIIWFSLSQKDFEGDYPSAPQIHTLEKAKEPWTAKVKAGADLYQVSAVQTTGTKLTCTIRDTHGAIRSTSTSNGKGTIVSCTVASGDLLSGLGGLGGLGGGSMTGSSIGAKALLPLR